VLRHNYHADLWLLYAHRLSYLDERTLENLLMVQAFQNSLKNQGKGKVTVNGAALDDLAPSSPAGKTAPSTPTTASPSPAAASPPPSASVDEKADTPTRPVMPMMPEPAPFTPPAVNPLMPQAQRQAQPPVRGHVHVASELGPFHVSDSLPHSLPLLLDQ
jgi:hypothetical protein